MSESSEDVRLRQFHGDGVWRDGAGGIWVRQSELVEAVEFAASHPVRVEVTDEMVERMARMLFAQTVEARNGFSWPLNGGVYREHDMERAKKALQHVLGGDRIDRESNGSGGES